jgi:hypothetical protein
MWHNHSKAPLKRHMKPSSPVKWSKVRVTLFGLITGAMSVTNQKSSNRPLTEATFGILENKGKMALRQFMYTESHEGDIAQQNCTKAISQNKIARRQYLMIIITESGYLIHYNHYRVLSLQYAPYE